MVNDFSENERSFAIAAYPVWFCVSVNMTPVDTFKFISRGTTRVQHSEVNRCHKRFADGETGSGRKEEIGYSMHRIQRILQHLTLCSFPN